ncbi:hypothetical protein [Bacillus sp. PS06]|uniref:hypothetical protein n=1 Tax=Bacillus sp. PS06 TaxID=2764176 RepID=UPI00177E93A5|nr:hypothetical protein [Bacillus sp. PS06]MBD8071328.1 hypothetical protein [Bacillus sp. PS06]
MFSGVVKPLMYSFLAAELYQVLAFGVIGDYPYMWAHVFKSIGWAVLAEKINAG